MSQCTALNPYLTSSPATILTFLFLFQRAWCPNKPTACAYSWYPDRFQDRRQVWEQSPAWLLWEASWGRAASGDECQLSEPTSWPTAEGEIPSFPPPATGHGPTAAPERQLLTVLRPCRYLDFLYWSYIILKFYFLILLIAVLQKSPEFLQTLDILQIGWAELGILFPSCRGQGESWGHPVPQRGWPLACQALGTRGEYLWSHSSNI